MSKDIDIAIDAAVERMATVDDFIKVVELMKMDFRDNSSEWENTTIPEFLEGIHGFSMALESYCTDRKIPFKRHGDCWRLFAEVLLAGRVYE